MAQGLLAENTGMIVIGGAIKSLVMKLMAMFCMTFEEADLA